jgi:hypothetical protein
MAVIVAVPESEMSRTIPSFSIVLEMEKGIKVRKLSSG